MDGCTYIYVVWSMRKSLANKTYVYSSLNIFQKAHKLLLPIILSNTTMSTSQLLGLCQW